MKSKRVCQGYDPVFQSQGPHSIHPAPSNSASNSHVNNTPTSASINNQSRRFTASSISPSGSGQNPGVVNSSPRDHSDYPFPRPPEQLLPHLNQPYHMDGPNQSGLPPYPPAGRRKCHVSLEPRNLLINQQCDNDRS